MTLSVCMHCTIALNNDACMICFYYNWVSLNGRIVKKAHRFKNWISKKGKKIFRSVFSFPLSKNSYPNIDVILHFFLSKYTNILLLSSLLNVFTLVNGFPVSHTLHFFGIINSGLWLKSCTCQLWIEINCRLKVDCKKSLC